MLRSIRRLAGGILALCAVLGGLAPVAGAQSYPTKPVRIIVTFAPGGGTDVVMRALGVALAEGLGQPVVVENRPGGGGNVGAEIAARADPDGYTLFAVADPHTLAPALYPKLNYDLVRDFAPVTRVAQGPYLLVAHPSLPVANVKELVAYAKQHPGELSYASSGSGTAAHLSGEMLKKQAGIAIDHVPYKGGGAAVADVVGGHVKLGMLGLAAPLPHVKSGALKALGVTSQSRLPVLPDVPTFAESGLGNFETLQWVGLMVPSGTPAPIVAKLHAEIVKAAANKSVVERLAASGLAVSTDASPDGFARFIRDDLQKWPPVVKASGAKPD